MSYRPLVDNHIIVFLYHIKEQGWCDINHQSSTSSLHDIMQMKVLPAFLHRSVQTEGCEKTLQNIQVQIQAEGGEENTETGEPNQDPENLCAEVQRHQPAGERRQNVRLHSCSGFF